MQVGVSPSTPLPARLTPTTPGPRAAGQPARQSRPIIPLEGDEAVWSLGREAAVLLPLCPQATCRLELPPHSPAPPLEPRGRRC